MRNRPLFTLGTDLCDSRWDETVARRVLAAWAASGQSLAGFARAHGLNAQRLSWWRKRLGEAERGDGVATTPRDGESVAPLTFIPAIPTGRATGVGVTVRLAGGVEVEAASTECLPASWVAELARVLGAAA